MNSDMTGDILPRTREFIRTIVMPAEPAPGDRLGADALLELQAAAKAARVFAPHMPTEFGGQGLSIRQWSSVFQEAGYSPIGPSVLNCMAPDEGNMHMLELIATQEQKQRYLVPLASGATRSCFAMTEPHPGAGSDPAALTTFAIRTVGGWFINGEKRFISGADGAGFCIVMARTDAGDGAAAGATMFIVETNNPGFSLGKQIHAIDRAIAGGHPHVHFTDCFVPDDAVIGEVGTPPGSVSIR